MAKRAANSRLGPPADTIHLREKLQQFLNTLVVDPVTGDRIPLGNYKFGVYAFFDYDLEPIYVGQTNEKLRTRIRRHLTNQRTDAVAMNVLDPFEVYKIQVWPIPQFNERGTADSKAKLFLNWLEYDVFQSLLRQSRFKAVLNEIDPVPVENERFSRPQMYEGVVVSDDVLELRKHPDTRIARRAGTLSMLAKVISERQVQSGLRRTLLTQAKRLAWLAERRLKETLSDPEPPED